MKLRKLLTILLLFAMTTGIAPVGMLADGLVDNIPPGEEMTVEAVDEAVSEAGSEPLGDGGDTAISDAEATSDDLGRLQVQERNIEEAFTENQGSADDCQVRAAIDDGGEEAEDPDLYAPLIGDLCPAKQGLDTKEHFRLIDGFRDIIIRPHKESLMFVRRKLLCRHHKNGKIALPVPQDPGEFITVHYRHHDIQDHQIDRLFFQQFQSLFSVFGRTDHVTVSLQNCPDITARVFVIVNNQDVKHFSTVLY